MPNKAIQLVQLLRSTKREKQLGTVILFVTSRCNSFCRTCFYHEELNRPGDMTFEQIQKTSRSMPPITDLWLSGGEPTLRHDASEIISMFVRNNGVRRLIIPTNGLVKSRVFEIVDNALGQHNALHLYLNIALDGYGKTHDRVRGVPGHWEKTLDCIGTLYPLKERYKDRLRLNVNTVICADNYLEIEKLGEFMWQNYRLDGQYFNIVRETLPRAMRLSRSRRTFCRACIRTPQDLRNAMAIACSRMMPRPRNLLRISPTWGPSRHTIALNIRTSRVPRRGHFPAPREKRLRSSITMAMSEPVNCARSSRV